MFDMARVTRMRNLLREADQVREAADRGVPLNSLFDDVAMEGLTRRALVAHIKLAGARFGLQEDIDTYLAAADRASLSGLETTQLRVLSAWLNRCLDRLATGADSPDGPPAR